MPNLNNIKVGVRAVSCKSCSRMNKGTEIYDAFDWSKPRLERIIGYDNKTGEITVNADGLMRIIQMVNPVQKPKPLKFVGQDEFYGVS